MILLKCLILISLCSINWFHIKCQIASWTYFYSFLVYFINNLYHYLAIEGPSSASFNKTVTFKVTNTINSSNVNSGSTTRLSK